DFLVATATDHGGDTSEFSAPVQVAAAASPLVVTTTADNGDNNNPTPGSLRAAILYADNNGGGTITFAIPTSDGGYNSFFVTTTIQPQSLLPELHDNVTIDGTSEETYLGTFTATPVIVIDGHSAGDVGGLFLAGSNITIKGIDVQYF